jgi:GR25 family glycosyltransferase involved in LPS biosynthesis
MINNINNINYINYINYIKSDYSNLKTFVINLDDYKENYIKQLPYLETIGLKVERFKGINALKDEHLNPIYKEYISNFAFKFTPKSVIGCALSHILCCKHIYENYINPNNNNNNNNAIEFNESSYGDKTPYFLIMEDDAFPKYVKEDFLNRLNKTIEDIEILDPNWEIIQLHSDFIYETKETYNVHLICGSTAAYLISKNGIKKTINDKIYSHIDVFLHNFIKYKKYRTKINLFYTNEKDSLNRSINKTKNLSYYSLYTKTNILELFNKYTNLLELRGEKTWEIFLEFKMLKLPYFKKEYTANEIIDILLGIFLMKKTIKYLK